MGTYSLTHVSDQTLLQNLADLVARDRRITAALLAHLAEVEERRLFAQAGYSSMFAYCTGELHLSEGATYKRITAARVARRCPAAFTAVADGRLHLSGLTLLAAKLDPSNADELIAACTHKTKAEIEAILAARFPQPDVPTRVRLLPSREASAQKQAGLEGLATQGPGLSPHAPGTAPPDETVAASPPEALAPTIHESANSMPTKRDEMSHELSPGRVDPARARLKPLSADRVALQVTISKSTHAKLVRAQELLSHSIPSRDEAQVLDRALDALIAQLEKRKLAATQRPRRASRAPREGSRHIPAHVKRAVRARDKDQCTYVSRAGRRCTERSRLEYDHVVPFALGGRATVDNIRQRCRGHNQHAADGVFGAVFMRRKREQSRRAAGP